MLSNPSGPCSFRFFPLLSFFALLSSSRCRRACTCSVVPFRATASSAVKLMPHVAQCSSVIYSTDHPLDHNAHAL